jgi:hypothetical protein
MAKPSKATALILDADLATDIRRKECPPATALAAIVRSTLLRLKLMPFLD